MTTLLQTSQDIFYPENDGQPMSENTEHYRWIVTIKENLEILFAADANIFVAGDLLWYPLEGDRDTCAAPDVMVIFGVPKGKRGCYLQWQDGNIAPQIAFEIRSPSNSNTELKRKFNFYQKHGVEEYYVYDPQTLVLDGWQRQGQLLEPILNMNDWVSPLLGIRFLMTTMDLELYRPDGRKFLTSVELEQERERAEQRAEQAEQKRDQERQLREQAEQKRDQERQRAERLAAHLRALNIDPDLLD